MTRRRSRNRLRFSEWTLKKEPQGSFGNNVFCPGSHTTAPGSILYLK